MNDIITDFSKSFNKPETEVTAAWELAKEQAKNLYADTDEEYFPYVVSLVKKNIAVDQKQKNMDGEQKTSLFTNPPETSQGIAPANHTFMSSKQEDTNDVLMFFAETEYRYTFLKEFFSKLCKEFPNFKEAKEVSRMLTEAMEKTSDKLSEASDRSVSTIAYTFPAGISGLTNITDISQTNGLLSIFGRGVANTSGIVKLGNASMDHSVLERGIPNPIRFYYGYNRDTQTVYVSPKNRDGEILKSATVIKSVLSEIFNKYKLSVAAGKKLTIKESKIKEDGEGGDAGGTVTSSSFDAAPFDGGRNRKDWKKDWDSQKPKSPQCKKNKKKKGKFYRLVDLSSVDKD